MSIKTNSQAILDLSVLLEQLEPVLDPEDYVYCVVSDRLHNFEHLTPLATFQEAEGLTLVLTKPQAEQLGADISMVFKRITLSVYSSLEAVGLTAAVATVLAQHGISANMIAAYYHDHVFVPAEKATKAMKVLAQIQL